MSSRNTSREVLCINGLSVEVALRRNPRARRLTLRLMPECGGLMLTMPPCTPVAQGLSFVHRQGDWISRQLRRLPPAVPFRDGSEIPILGDPHVIRHLPEARRGVWREPGCLWVSGRAEHLKRRVHDYLRREARAELGRRAREKAERLPLGRCRTLGSLRVRDTSSRWGSCTARGDLSFSWRLIMAPEQVLDYVVAHEVAHLLHLNHSPCFWALVEELTTEVTASRRWLRYNGARLLRYG